MEYTSVQESQQHLKSEATAYHGAADSPLTPTDYQYTPQREGYFPPGPEPSQRPLRRGLTTLKWWWPECLASVVSIASLVGIAAIAGHYRGLGIQDDGLPSGLTLNGLIALLATITRAALLIPIASTLSQEAWLWLAKGRRAQLRDLQISDDASRGGWGSLLLLGHIRRSWLAYAASIVTIVSLLFGTFTQQLLTIKTFPVNESKLNPGNVPWASSWSNWTGMPSEGPPLPPLAFKAAAYNGILTNNGRPEPTPCSTGNCTWPVTPSVAICGGCVTSPYTVQCNSSDSSEDHFYDGMCSYTLPSGNIANLTNLDAVTHGVGFTTFTSYGHHYNMSDTSRIYLTVFEAVGMPAGTHNNDHGWQEDNTAVAYECALWGCIQTFETSQTNSNQTTVVRQTWDKCDVYSGDPFSNITFVDVPMDMSIPGGEPFKFLGLAKYALTTYFSTLFAFGNITVNDGIQTPSSDVIQALQNNTADLNAWIQNVAGSLTNVVRSFDASPDQPEFNGVAYQLGHDVRWAWIILPAIMVGLSVLLLIVVIIRTARSDVQPWKSNPLALLLMIVDREIAAQARGQFDRYNGLESTVGKNGAALKRDGDGVWGIKQT